MKGAVFVTIMTPIIFVLPIDGARILAVLPVFARSHHRFFQPLLKTLARAGHEVVVYSPFPLDTPEPNYTDVVIDNFTGLNDEIGDIIQEFTELPHHICTDLLITASEMVFNDFLKSKKIQELLSSKEHFDLLITETFVNQEITTVIVGHHFKTPVIALQSMVTNDIVRSTLGNALPIGLIPDLCSPFSNRMSFIERLRSTLHVIRNIYYLYYSTYIPSVDRRINKHFPDAPPLLEMMNNVSLVFVNDHLTADYPQPRTPNIIPVAGIHIEDEEPLPKDIQSFMDEATDGVILFSLGTYVPDELQPRSYFDMYINVFRQLRQRVLWKTRKENIQGLPDNVMTVKWAPQRDILAHPKCVLFITHGGLLSQHETIHYGVPVVVIPQFYDQHRNGKFYEEQGIGVRLNIKDLTTSTVLSSIRTVMDNPQYSVNMKKLSSVFRDRPMTPAQTVVFWTEYVLRHGASHLRPASTQLSWYQLALLDVLAVIVICIVSVIFTLNLICRKVFLKCRTNKEKLS